MKMGGYYVDNIVKSQTFMGFDNGVSAQQSGTVDPKCPLRSMY